MTKLSVALLCGLFAFAYRAMAATIVVGPGQAFAQIKPALAKCENGDTVLVKNGFYKEGNIVINKAIAFIGENFPVLDGDRKFEVLTIKADHVLVKGFRDNTPAMPHSMIRVVSKCRTAIM
jgi:nitrous oxidase accessory protein